MSASFRIRLGFLRFMYLEGGINVLKSFVNLKCKIHLFLQQYNEALVQDAVCDKLRSHLKQKASYHGQRAFSLMTKM